MVLSCIFALIYKRLFPLDKFSTKVNALCIAFALAFTTEG